MKCPYEDPTGALCKVCQIINRMPHAYCCLIECMEHEFCRSCMRVTILKGELP